MDFSNIFRIANLAVGVIMILGAIAMFIDGDAGSSSFARFIEGAYIIIFGLATAGLEFQIPPQVSRYASFMFSFIGRGIFYIFVGSILLGPNVFGYIAGAIVGLTGIGYVVLEFMPQIEPPSNMREADVGWGAEQV